MSLRVGLCGLGEIGQHHLGAIRTSEHAELAAVCDLDAELGSAAGVPHFGELDEMLAVQDLDVIDVCLPHSLHERAALAAIESGCHVLLEKPMAIGLGACDRIAAAAADAGLLVGVSHNQIFYGPHRRAAELLESGALGELRQIHARLWIGGRYGGWRQDPEVAGGGLLMDAGIHRVYMLRELGGPVRSVSARMDEPRAELDFSLSFEFESGATGVAQGAYHGPEGIFDDRLDVLGTAGIAQVAGCEAFFEGDLRDVAQLRVRVDGEWQDEDVSHSWDSSVSTSVHSLLASFAAGEAPRVDAVAGRETVALIEAAYRSAEQGEPVDPGSLGSD